MSMKRKPVSIIDRERVQNSQTGVSKKKNRSILIKSQVSPGGSRKEDAGAADETSKRPAKRQKTDGNDQGRELSPHYKTLAFGMY